MYIQLMAVGSSL